MRRAILITALMLLTAGGIILLAAAESETNYNGPEELYFSQNSNIYVLGDELTHEKVGPDRGGVYFDGRIYYGSGSAGIRSSLPDGSDVRDEVRIELTYSGDQFGRPDIGLYASRHTLIVDEEYIFFNMLTIEAGAYFICRLTRETGELTPYPDAKCIYERIYHDGYIWFVNGTDEGYFISKLDPGTGVVEALTKEIFAAQAANVTA